MLVKRAKPEEIIAKLREAEVRLSQGESVGMADKSIGVSEQTYYGGRKDQVAVWIGTAGEGRIKAVGSERHRKIVSVVVIYPFTTFTIIAALVLSGLVERL